MTGKPTHRPAPWRVFTAETDDRENVYPKLMTADYQHEIFAFDNSSDQDFADAHFIVHRVNCHDDLVNEIERLRKVEMQLRAELSVWIGIPVG